MVRLSPRSDETFREFMGKLGDECDDATLLPGLVPRGDATPESHGPVSVPPVTTSTPDDTTPLPGLMPRGDTTPESCGPVPAPPTATSTPVPDRDSQRQELVRPGLHQTPSPVGTTIARWTWTGNARIFYGKDTSVVSQDFHLTCGGSQLPFKLSIHPSGGASFKKSGGKGIVRVKCNADVKEEGSVSNTFWMSVGPPPDSIHVRLFGGARPQPAIGPLTHDFSAQSFCEFPHEQDFRGATGAQSSTFTVCVWVQQ